DGTAIDGTAIAGLPSSAHADPLSSLEAQERRAFLHRQIDGLPESYRLLIALRYQQELSYAEIAEIVDLPLGTVKTGLFRARERLRQALQAYEQEPAWTS
ncbi:MAG: sigma-70 family RNA polymerase sigma factor, partial [Anaerolineales bacterium]|nr:sigma-70 family RNA polymerase sigma factor [Anaerolineales bacterium]